MSEVKVKLAGALAKVKVKVAALWAKSKAVGMSLAVAASLTLPAFATGTGDNPSGSSGLSSITSAADTVTTFINKAFEMMTGNPLLCVYLASSLIGVGIYKFVQLRRAAH